ncbi:MAG: 5-formyltetrahydrofolate cyclo-ligase [Candidatus Micrarchaeota archaeon]
MVQHLKKALREKMLKARGSIVPKDVAQMSASIAERLLAHPRFKEAKTIGFYIPKGNEVDTRPMIAAAIGLGKTVAAPVTAHKMVFYPFESLDSLVPGKFGIPEPKTHGMKPIEPELVVVPGVVFGLCMHRLGYGKGYYDSYLAHSFAYRIGICYDFQVVDKLPRHDNDQRMDEIITEKRVITL